MSKPSSPPGRRKDEKATKNVASFQRAKGVAVNVNIPADELVQYGQAEIDLLASNIVALSEALASVKEDDDEPIDPLPAA